MLPADYTPIMMSLIAAFLSLGLALIEWRRSRGHDRDTRALAEIAATTQRTQAMLNSGYSAALRLAVLATRRLAAQTDSPEDQAEAEEAQRLYADYDRQRSAALPPPPPPPSA
jgi:hypothetical protein